jgi:HEAT repeat protein
MHAIVFALTALSVAPIQAAPSQDPAPSMRAVVEHIAAERHAIARLAVEHRAVAEAVSANAAQRHALSTQMRLLEEVVVAERSLAIGGHNIVLPPAGWAAQDPADSLWRAARTTLDNGDARRAAELYLRLRSERRFASSEYRSHAFYWEAYARQRIGGPEELRRARSALRSLRQAYPRFENMVEVERLESRLNGQLAAVGDTAATTRVTTSVNQAASQCPDQEMRVTVLESFISMPSEQAMPILKQVMARKDACNAPLREKAVFIISQKRSSEAEDLLLDAVRNDPEPKVREQAVFWLSQVNSEKSLVAIEEILRTATDSKLIEQAVFAASQHRSPRSAQILRDIAGRANAPTEVRKNAIFWLGQSRAADVSSFMRSLYGAVNDTELKEAVLFALSQNRDASNADFLFEIAMDNGEPIEMRKSALFWAGQKRALPLDRLGELYRTMSDREMREAIIFTISQRREPEAVERLIDIARSETDVKLKSTIIFWLGQSRDPRAIKFLGDLVTG